CFLAYRNLHDLATIGRVQARKIRVLAVDHNPLLREGLSLLIQLQPEMELAAAVTSGKEAVQSFTQHRPDVTLMVLDLPSAARITAIQEILKIDSAASVLGLFTYEWDESRARYACRCPRLPRERPVESGPRLAGAGLRATCRLTPTSIVVPTLPTRVL